MLPRRLLARIIHQYSIGAADLPALTGVLENSGLRRTVQYASAGNLCELPVIAGICAPPLRPLMNNAG